MEGRRPSFPGRRAAGPVLPRNFSHDLPQPRAAQSASAMRRRKLSQANGHPAGPSSSAAFQRDRPELLCQIRRMEHLRRPTARRGRLDRPAGRRQAARPPRRVRGRRGRGAAGVHRRRGPPARASTASGADGRLRPGRRRAAAAPRRSPSTRPRRRPWTAASRRARAPGRRPRRSRRRGASPWRARSPPRRATTAAPDAAPPSRRDAGQMLVERDAFISQLAKTHPGAMGGEALAGHAGPPTVDAEALPPPRPRRPTKRPRRATSRRCRRRTRPPTARPRRPLCAEPPPAAV